MLTKHLLEVKHIKYTYNIGKDPVKNADELYFNLIGDEWDTVINNISFKITMPKSFDKSLLGFSSGQTGSTNSSNAYALGLSDVWIKQFESIAVRAPRWYNSHNYFSIHTFGTFMRSTMTSVSTAVSSSSGGGGSW